MPPSKELGTIAVAQLTAWRRYAAKWNYHLEARHTSKDHRSPGVEQFHLICANCHRSIALMMHEGIGYLMNTELVLDNVTRHLRNFHRGLEASIYGTENATPVDHDRASGDSNGSHLDLG